jgi:hypothetical protein
MVMVDVREEIIRKKFKIEIDSSIYDLAGRNSNPILDLAGRKGHSLIHFCE